MINGSEYFIKIGSVFEDIRHRIFGDKIIRYVFFRKNNPSPIMVNDINREDEFEALIQAKVVTDFLGIPKPDFTLLMIVAIMAAIVGFIIGVLIHIK